MAEILFKEESYKIMGAMFEVYNENYDLITTVQAGYIGHYGEMHASTNGFDRTSVRQDSRAALSLLVSSLVARFDLLVN